MIRNSILIRVAAAAYVTQGLVLAGFIFNTDKIYKQGKYLASVVEKNAENLDEFDLIALRELGIIKPPTHSS
jgi:hypothetical protein